MPIVPIEQAIDTEIQAQLKAQQEQDRKRKEREKAEQKQFKSDADRLLKTAIAAGINSPTISEYKAGEQPMCSFVVADLKGSISYYGETIWLYIPEVISTHFGLTEASSDPFTGETLRAQLIKAVAAHKIATGTVEPAPEPEVVPVSE